MPTTEQASCRRTRRKTYFMKLLKNNNFSSDKVKERHDRLNVSSAFKDRRLTTVRLRMPFQPEKPLQNKEFRNKRHRPMGMILNKKRIGMKRICRICSVEVAPGDRKN